MSQNPKRAANRVLCGYKITVVSKLDGITMKVLLLASEDSATLGERHERRCEVWREGGALHRFSLARERARLPRKLKAIKPESGQSPVR